MNNTLTSLILQRIDHILTFQFETVSDYKVQVNLEIDIHDKNYQHFRNLCFPDGGVNGDLSNLTLNLKVSAEKWTLVIKNFSYSSLIRNINLTRDIILNQVWRVDGYSIDNNYRATNPIGLIRFLVNSDDTVWFECVR